MSIYLTTPRNLRMPNSNYNKGVRKERKLVNMARDMGLIAFRSAGSHSPIDVCIIDLAAKTIDFIQCKPDSWSEKQKKNLERNYFEVNGVFNVKFSVR